MFKNNVFKKIMIVVLSSIVLVGCNQNTSPPKVSTITDVGLEDCVKHEYDSDNLIIVRCPNPTVTTKHTYQSGKTTNSNTSVTVEEDVKMYTLEESEKMCNDRINKAFSLNK